MNETEQVKVNSEILRVTDLKFKYPSSRNYVLNGVNFSFHAGEKVAVLGCNGAGKTTFFNIVSGLIPGYSGDISLFGTDVRKMKRGDMAKKLALVPQKHEPLFPFTVKDFILMGRYTHMGLMGNPDEEDKRCVLQAAEDTGASKFLDRPYTSLSGGEMQLSVIARALAQQTEMLILDEPSNHLDFRNRFLVLDLINRIADKRGTGLLMSLHDPNDVLRFADRAVVFDGGKIIEDGKPCDIITKDLLKDVFGVIAEKIEDKGFIQFIQTGVC